MRFSNLSAKFITSFLLSVAILSGCSVDNSVAINENLPIIPNEANLQTKEPKIDEYTYQPEVLDISSTVEVEKFGKLKVVKDCHRDGWCGSKYQLVLSPDTIDKYKDKIALLGDIKDEDDDKFIKLIGKEGVAKHSGHLANPKVRDAEEKVIDVEEYKVVSLENVSDVDESIRQYISQKYECELEWGGHERTWRVRNNDLIYSYKRQTKYKEDEYFIKANYEPSTNRILNLEDNVGDWDVCTGTVGLMTNAEKESLIESFCGKSRGGECETDSDCMTGGCNGEFCGNEKKSAGGSFCEWQQCLNGKVLFSCSCVNNKCGWVVD